MEQIILDALGPMAIVAIMCGMSGAAITHQAKKQLGLNGWQALLVQVMLSVVLATLLVIVTAQAPLTDGWILIQYVAAGLLGGLITAAGWDFAGRLSDTK